MKGLGRTEYKSFQQATAPYIPGLSKISLDLSGIEQLGGFSRFYRTEESRIPDLPQNPPNPVGGRTLPLCTGNEGWNEEVTAEVEADCKACCPKYRPATPYQDTDSKNSRDASAAESTDSMVFQPANRLFVL